MSMWGRKEPEEQPKPPVAPSREPAKAPSVETTSVAPQPAVPPRGAAGMDQQIQQRRAIIGPSIHVKGELIGNEDLVVEGRVEGVIRLKEHHLTVGKSAEVQATLEAKSIRVEGTVHGDVQAGERVELAAGSTLVGDITAPRIIISDGARFKGSVDMDHAPRNPERREPAPASVTTAPQPKPTGVAS